MGKQHPKKKNTTVGGIKAEAKSAYISFSSDWLCLLIKDTIVMQTPNERDRTNARNESLEKMTYFVQYQTIAGKIETKMAS
mmetsp:Transcript_38662/g.39077  ORF Transcript_38662/g.39077 Transcript_38662/m.39077 type:complete len:81 (-) Transcript_38662:74-316(-)